MNTTTDTPMINYENSSLKEISESEISRLTFLLAEMKKEEHLCGEISEAVVYEFNLKGTKQEVEAQLQLQIGFYKEGNLTDMYRQVLRDNDNRLLRFNQTHKNSEYRNETIKAIFEEDLEKADNILDSLKQRNANLHKDKQCICYCNGE
ncbi:MAG: hypothetical protein ACTSQA_06025 [Candidatus Heimdallarchaeaceae archaeon]